MNGPPVPGFRTPESPFEAPAPGTPAATVFLCALCGCRFTHGGRTCLACPLSAGCDVVSCPNCGFQFPRASWIADGLARVWRRWMERP